MHTVIFLDLLGSYYKTQWFAPPGMQKEDALKIGSAVAERCNLTVTPECSCSSSFFSDNTIFDCKDLYISLLGLCENATEIAASTLDCVKQNLFWTPEKNNCANEDKGSSLKTGLIVGGAVVVTVISLLGVAIYQKNRAKRLQERAGNEEKLADENNNASSNYHSISLSNGNS